MVIRMISNGLGVIPTVVENSGRNERFMDLYSSLLMQGVIFLDTEIDPNLASIICAKLIYLDSQGKDAQIVINSPGGDVMATLAIYDAIKHVKINVSTICIGQACSGAAIILVAGTKGKRSASPHSRIMIHQAHGQVSGQMTDMVLHLQEAVRQNDVLIDIIVKHTGIEREEVVRLVDRDTFINPQKAKEMGIIDTVLEQAVV